MLLACAERGITKKPEWLDLIAAMKFSDYDCITDAKAANTSYHSCTECGFTGFMPPKLNEKNEVLVDGDGNQVFTCPNIIAEDDKHAEKEEAAAAPGD